MSMTREEAIEVLENGGWWDSLIPVTTIEGRIEDDKLHEALDLALSALRPVSRERVEKVWMGEWVTGEPDVLCVPIHCSRCGWGSDYADQRKWMEYNGHLFCGHCGAPMTEEAVEMVMERINEMEEMKK